MDSINKHSLTIKEIDLKDMNKRWENDDYITFSRTNRHLNRYNNIIPFSHNCVKLSSSSKYINASITSDYKYIMTQSPLPGTREDFWEMVHLYKCDLIIMLVKVQEGKCEQYWPEPFKTDLFNNFSITNISIPLVNSSTITTTLSLRRRDANGNDYGNERIIKHFNFIEWPDHSIPSIEFSKFDSILKDPIHQTSNPAIVHCSAGIERSASFIIMKSPIPSDIKKLEDLIAIIRDRIIEMRKQRIYAVQLPRQFKYIVEYFCYILNISIIT